jgi:hypothetical protein
MLSRLVRWFSRLLSGEQYLPTPLPPELRLTTGQRNDLYNLAQQGGLSADNCELQKDLQNARIKHLPSGSSFEIRINHNAFEIGWTPDHEQQHLYQKSASGELRPARPYEYQPIVGNKSVMPYEWIYAEWDGVKKGVAKWAEEVRPACSDGQVQAWMDAVVCSWRGLAGAVAVTVAVTRAV